MWNARHGFEQGRLYYWLDTIQALAPKSPVMVVSTWSDERSAELPLEDIKRRYPAVCGHWTVSNLTGVGLHELMSAAAGIAADLPLMGESWPTKWLAATDAIRSHSERFVTPARLAEIADGHGLEIDRTTVLARWLHELGEVLYFIDNPELNDTVILKPQWVTRVISRVLESTEVEAQNGVLTREHMGLLWQDIDVFLQQHLLRLMEQFDLSYRTLENRDISIVVERLSLDPPAYHQTWEAALSQPGARELSMKFEFGSTIPAGVPTWFIARSHRFTTYQHWRYGALFGDSPNSRHVALVQCFPQERVVHLTVRGPTPHNFFNLLRDGFELTLARFPGLQISRKIPCPGHDGEYCDGEFDYERLQKGIEREPPVSDVQCPATFEKVSLTKLLFGVHWRTHDLVVDRIDKLESKLSQQHSEVLEELHELRALHQREFLKMFTMFQENIDVCCPNVFLLRPHRSGSVQTLLGRGGASFRDTLMDSEVFKSVIGERVELHLFCQNPGDWHLTDDSGSYVVDKPSQWIQGIAPYISRLMQVMRFVLPLAGWTSALKSEDMDEKLLKWDLEFTKALAEQACKTSEVTAAAQASTFWSANEMVSLESGELRVLRKLLDTLDHRQLWGGLGKIPTPEGHYLWLCRRHARIYE